jgi:hypothetical protein
MFFRDGTLRAYFGGFEKSNTTTGIFGVLSDFHFFTGPIINPAYQSHPGVPLFALEDVALNSSAVQLKNFPHIFADTELFENP